MDGIRIELKHLAGHVRELVAHLANRLQDGQKNQAG